jgi:hypothetical protein
MNYGVFAAEDSNPNTAVSAKVEKVSDDPFLNSSEEEEYEKEEREILTSHTVSAILSTKDNPSAVVDGRVVKKGDFIEDMEVIQIKTEEVILKDFWGAEYAIRMEKIIPE